MGLFDRMKQGAAAGQGDWAAQAAQAQQLADQILQDSGYAAGVTGVTAANGQEIAQQGIADREAIQAQAYEQNRILTVGSPASITIVNHTETGEQIAGQPVWLLNLQVTPEGGAPYAVQKREIVSTYALGSYADGTVQPGRIDPADPLNVAFGEAPFL